MLVTPDIDRRNRKHAIVIASATALMCGIIGWFYHLVYLAWAFCPFIYWFFRRRCLRRLWIMKQPFPASWEEVLQNHVAFFRVLSDDQKERFRHMVSIFLDEVRITGIQTEINDTIRVLVAASAIIPIFGFHDWDYHLLGEVLIYPSSFGDEYQTSGKNRNTLGLVGLHKFSGIMILSKPDLLAGFDTSLTKDNVGIHEFAHMVEEEEVKYGLPHEVPWQAVKQWVNYVGRELSQHKNRSFLRNYAYTNDHEFFAVLAEYFFKSPELLKEKDPELYKMLQKLFHQDTASMMKLAFSPNLKYRQNDLCPCVSGKKYKDCCLSKPTYPKSSIF